MSGKKPSEDTLYGREIGIEPSRKASKVVRRLGGSARLRALSPEVRNLLTARIGKSLQRQDGK